MTLTGNTNTDTQNLQVGQGGVTFSGAGTAVFGTYTVLPTATLLLDNSGTNVNNRSGTTSTLTVAGGNFTMIGNASAPTTETVATLNIDTTGNLWGGSVVTLQANAAQSLTLTTKLAPRWRRGNVGPHPRRLGNGRCGQGQPQPRG